MGNLVVCIGGISLLLGVVCFGINDGMMTTKWNRRAEVCSWIMGGTFLLLLISIIFVEYADGADRPVVKLDGQGHIIQKSSIALWCFTERCMRLPALPIKVTQEYQWDRVKISATYAVTVTNWDLFLHTSFPERRFLAISSTEVEGRVIKGVEYVFQAAQDEEIRTSHKENLKSDVRVQRVVFDHFLQPEPFFFGANQALDIFGLKLETPIALQIDRQIGQK